MTRNAAAAPETVSGALPDAVPSQFLFKIAPASFRPYLQLARIDRPIGWWLLLLPCWQSSALAAGVEGKGLYLSHLLLFLIGAIVMRGAGSTWNDILDRKIDAQVERTKNRPIPSGQVSAKAAFVFAIFLSFIGLAVLLQLNRFAILTGAASLLIVREFLVPRVPTMREACVEADEVPSETEFVSTLRSTLPKGPSPVLEASPEVLKAARNGLAQLWRTISHVTHYKNVATFLVVRAIYADGMSAVFTFLAGYLGGIFGWSTGRIGIFALIVLTVPIFTSIIGGWIDDLIGTKRTIQICLLGFTLAVLGSVSTTPDEYLFFWAVTDEIRAQQLPVIGPWLAMFGFTQFPEQLSLTFSIMGGAFVGPVLASGRTMVARISPREMMSEVYGLFTLTGKATAFLAPFFVALVTSATQNQRAGFAVILVFLVAGLVGLFWVREERAELAPR